MTTTELLHPIGRMFMVGVRGAEPGDAGLEADLDACAGVGIGGVILFSTSVPGGGERNVRSPEQLARLTSHIRERLGPGTLIGIDQEGGRVARLTPERGFAPSPSARDYASMPRDERKEHADRLALELSSAGINWNFAPCVDVDHDPPSPVIGALDRAYAHDPSVVVECAHEVMEAHRAHGLAVSIKHFPGHGASADDSHMCLPDISDRHRAEIDLAPFRSIIASSADDGLLTVMTAHVLHRGLDRSLPASLSPAITTRLLRETLGFAGVVVTDSLDMNGVRDQHSLTDACRLALLAGADVLLDGCNGPVGDTAGDVARSVRELAEWAESSGPDVHRMITESAARRARLLEAIGLRSG